MEREVASLPSEVEMDEVEARLFDLKILRLQVCLVEENEPGFDKLRQSDGGSRPIKRDARGASGGGDSFLSWRIAGG